MENSAPPAQQAGQPPIPPYQPPYQPPYHQPFVNPPPPFGFVPIQQSFAPPPTAAAPWGYPGQAAAPPAGGQYSQGFGRGSNGNYQQRAFFTKEHADFIDKLKVKEAIEDARRKDREEIERLKEQGKEKSRVKEVNTKQAGKTKDKGKVKMMDDRKKDEMKRWVADNFGNSIRVLTEKLEEVEKKSKLKEGELEELRLLRAEKKLRELREGSSSEKRKRDGDSPVKPKTSKLDATVQKPDEISELKDLLKALLASKEAAASTSGGGDMGKEKDRGQTSEEKTTEEAENGGKIIGKEKERENGGDEESLGLYFKDRVIYYDSLHYTEIQALCKSKNIGYKRK
ncbi:hypothetical protein CBR_g37822 [Chara braunii]|uniref:Uncharacterized protein n=1 Tax=Chara braunii TaxID=69332 RepID=A0A388LNM9_CHABU|nr:hypothetical protein CBR_g37822 [Chara braunii]|eukprot:GBG83950.1 hypothetical protein CBR_g37822 [Chara braunii]